MNDEISMGDLVNLISKLMDKDIEIIQNENRIRPAESEVERLYCNNQKLKKFTNWVPEYTLKEGLELTINWIIKNIDNYKSHIYNV